MRELAHWALKAMHHALPEFIKRPVRQWYLMFIYYRLFPEVAIPSYRYELEEGPSPTTPFRCESGHASPKTIICLPVIDWFFRYQRPQHLLTGLAAAGYRILYLDPHLDGLPYKRKARSLQDRWMMSLSEHITMIKLPSRV